MKILLADEFVWSIETHWPLLLVIALIIVAGLILFIFVGFIGVKKGRVAIIERVGLYVETIERTKFYTPIIYRRAGYYKLGPQKVIKVLPNGKKAILIMEIGNPILYHYSGHNLDQELKNYYDFEEHITFSGLSSHLRKIGLNLLDISQAVDNNA